MDMYSRRQYLKTLHQKYLEADKTGKTAILDEYIKNTGHNRKYVISQLANVKLLNTTQKRNTRRASKYKADILEPLEKLYGIFDCPCGQRLEPIIKETLEHLRDLNELKITDEQAKSLKEMSSATIDRKLKKIREKHHKKGFTTTKPGSLLKSQIPIRLTSWDSQKIGFQEVDLVAHCGSNARGSFAHTLSLTEIISTWWEGEAIMNKGQKETLDGLKLIEERTPYEWLGIDSDNGSEFINYHLFNHCKNKNLVFTRSRPNKKNDNAYIEQKNWTHVRKVVGYARYDTAEEITIINDLYRNELRLYKNFFQPTMKLKKKSRVEGRLKRKYEKAKTPFHRLIESNQIPNETKKKLKQVYANLNPAELKRSIERKLYKLKLANQQKGWEKPVDLSKPESGLAAPSYKHIHTCPQRKSSKKKFTATVL